MTERNSHFHAAACDGARPMAAQAPSIVRDLACLVERGAKFATVYADPPWPYSNTAARGAAEDHYRTLSLDAIRSQPIKALAAENAHLHLWTTNGFLREAFDIIQAWGFRYKSCLIWIKPQMGMGNYWRVSHEYLLLGVRGNLPFRDRTCRSWHLARRTIHSRKPFLFRALIERVSPGPYLELYGREEQPRTEWTVFGNQVERRLF
jgi:N6-adenosine-specific RNA methylase IME4